MAGDWCRGVSVIVAGGGGCLLREAQRMGPCRWRVDEGAVQLRAEDMSHQVQWRWWRRWHQSGKVDGGGSGAWLELSDGAGGLWEADAEGVAVGV